ncbi:MAG: TIGR04255 family protein [Deltaproteobacteria bacterium]|nr:TIGR04255 family protein [Deltaproteobacteria bacterium]
MSDKILYPKNPIVEALVDIRIDPRLNTLPSEFEAIHTKLQNEYPEKKARRSWETKLEIKDGAPVQTMPVDHGIDGFQFISSDKKNICQFRMDGFTFSRLRPYERWEVFLPKCMRSWQIYKTELQPKNISRLAVRFINLIEIPSANFELSDYFVEAPHPPKSLSQELEGFLNRFVIKLNESTKAVTTTTIHGSKNKPDVTPILFDIDVFSMVDLPIFEIEKSLTDLHDNVEKIFFESLTTKAKELFK